jgi:glucose-6-phosphate dehydrogenase assembly protein OpcA
MKIDLTDTTSARINAGLIEARRAIGTPAVGMVLTLVIVTDEGSAYDALKAAHEASREHPSRILVVIKRPGRSPRERAGARLDAEVVVGAEAGTGETVVLRMHGELANHAESVVLPLLLPDAPVVCWWPDQSPGHASEDPLGRLAQRRITDASSAEDPVGSLAVRAAGYAPGDTDLAWTRITRWRGLLASCLDQPPHDKITEASVAGAADSPSADLLAAWLALALKVPVKRIKSPAKSGPGLHSVVLCRRAGDISLIRPQTITAELRVANQPERHVALPRRGLRDCLSEELRRLDADDVYAEVLTKGMALVAKHAAAAETKAQPAKAPPAKAPAATASAVNAPPRRASAAKAAVAPAAKAAAAPAAKAAVAPAAKPRSTAIRRAAATGVDDPAVIADSGSPTGIPPGADPAASNGEAPPAGAPDATAAAPRRRRAATSKPAESS